MPRAARARRRARRALRRDQRRRVRRARRRAALRRADVREVQDQLAERRHAAACPTTSSISRAPPRWRGSSRPIPRRSPTRSRSPSAARFRLDKLAGQFPLFPIPPEESSTHSYLRTLVYRRRAHALRHAARAQSRAPTRIRTRHHRAHGPGRLFPRGLGHRARRRRTRRALPRPRLGGQLRGLLRARHHRGRSGRHEPALRALPLRRAQRDPRHRHRLRAPRPREGHPVRLRALRPRTRRDDGRSDHLPHALGDSRRRQGARALARAGRRDLQRIRRARIARGRGRRRGRRARQPAAVGAQAPRSRRRQQPARLARAGGRSARAVARALVRARFRGDRRTRARARNPRAGRRPRGRVAAGAVPADRRVSAAHGHPLRRHDDHARSARASRAGRVGDDARPHDRAVGQGRPRRSRPDQDRSAGPGHALALARRVRAARAAISRAPAARARDDPARRQADVRDAAAAPTRSASSKSSRARSSRCCRA